MSEFLHQRKTPQVYVQEYRAIGDSDHGVLTSGDFNDVWWALWTGEATLDDIRENIAFRQAIFELVYDELPEDQKIDVICSLLWHSGTFDEINQQFADIRSRYNSGEFSTIEQIFAAYRVDVKENIQRNIPQLSSDQINL